MIIIKKKDFLLFKIALDYTPSTYDVGIPFILCYTIHMPLAHHWNTIYIIYLHHSTQLPFTIKHAIDLPFGYNLPHCIPFILWFLPFTIQTTTIYLPHPSFLQPLIHHWNTIYIVVYNLSHGIYHSPFKQIPFIIRHKPLSH